MKHSPFNHDVDDDQADEESSAEEDASEEELLIAASLPRGTEEEPWGRRDTLIAGLCIAGWCAASITTVMANKLLLRRAFPQRCSYPFFASFVYMLIKWLLSRVTLLAMRQPPLAFRSWHPYGLTIATAGVLTSLDVGLSLTSYLYVNVTFIVIMKATLPCFQLVFSVLLGMEVVRPGLIAVVLLISSGIGFAAVGEVHSSWKGFFLLLGAATLAGLRGCLLQHVLHGHDVRLLVQRFRVHPIQLLCAVAPWTTFTSLLATLALESDMRSFHLPQLCAFTPWHFGVGCLIFCMVLAEMHVISKTSALTLSVAGTLKDLIAIATAERVFGDHMTVVNAFGLTLCFVGANLYGYLKLAQPSSVRSAHARKRMEDRLAYGREAAPCLHHQPSGPSFRRW